LFTSICGPNWSKLHLLHKPKLHQPDVQGLCFKQWVKLLHWIYLSMKLKTNIWFRLKSCVIFTQGCFKDLFIWTWHYIIQQKFVCFKWQSRLLRSTKMISTLPRYAVSLISARATRQMISLRRPSDIYRRNGLLSKSKCLSVVQLQNLSCSPLLFEKPSSKIEETVQHLKQEKDEKIDYQINVTDAHQIPGILPLKIIHFTLFKFLRWLSVVVLAKKSLKQRFIDECKHYYSGFKLLFLDVKVSSKIIWKILKGNGLTRRERKQLVRTTSDVFR